MKAMELTALGLYGLFSATSVSAYPSRVFEASRAEVRSDAPKLPLRPARAITGSEFIAETEHMGPEEREEAIAREIEAGNLPSYLSHFQTIELSMPSPRDGHMITAKLFVMPDYLAIGSDDDHVLMPMSLPTALRVARHYGMALPTAKLVDEIYKQSIVHLKPRPLPACRAMTSVDYYMNHNAIIERERSGFARALLTSGHKKDIVLTNRLNLHPTSIAIYGWHREGGLAIQPLSTVHSAEYADYSHGVRLVSTTVEIDGVKRSLYDALRDPEVAALLTDEGTIDNAEVLMGLVPRPTRLIVAGS